MGHQHYFLALLPRSEVLLVSGIGKGNFYCEHCFYFYLLLCLIMEKSPFDSLFGNNAADAEVVDEAPHVSEILFKIPMKFGICLGVKLASQENFWNLYLKFHLKQGY